MQQLTQQINNLRLIIFDVDGVLTNGQLIYTEQGHELKAFHSRDGVGIKLIQQTSLEIAIISGRSSPTVTRRMQELGIKYVYQGQQDKLVAYNQLKSLLNLTDQQIAYVGDDLPDVAVMQQAGLAIIPADASVTMERYAHYRTRAAGGFGVAREIADLLLNPEQQLMLQEKQHAQQ